MNSPVPAAVRAGLDVEIRDRLDRLDALTAQQQSAALSCLAAYDSAAFDAVLDEVTGAGRGADPANSQPAEAYCLLCGGPLEAHGADHEPFPAWRPRQ